MIGLLTLSTRETATFLSDHDFWPTILYPTGIVRYGRVENGKTPIGRKWGRTRLTPNEIEKCFKEFPNAGVGICLGPDKGPGSSWLIDIEVDERESGDASLLKLFGGEIIETMGWGSERGDHRLFYADRARMGKVFPGQAPGTKFAELPGLEIRGLARSQVQSAVPPTPGANGGSRQWNGCWTIADLPEAVYAFLEQSIRPKAGKRLEPVLRDPRRRSKASSKYVETALSNECDLVAGAAEGERHDTLRDAALKTGRFVKGGYLDEAKCKHRLAEVGLRSGLPESEVDETITWGLLHAEACALPRPPVPQVKEVSTQAQDSTPDLGLVSDSEGKSNTQYLQKEHVYHYGEQRRPVQSHESSLEPNALAVIRKHIITKPDNEPWKTLTRLRREIEPIALEQSWRKSKWKEVAAYWWRASNQSGARLPMFNVVWSKFERMLETPIATPFGSEMDRVRRKIPSMRVPRQLIGTGFEAIAKTMKAYAALARRRGRPTFYAPYRTIAELSGLKHPAQAKRLLCALHGLGFINLTEAGTPGNGRRRQASTWQWFDRPRPSKTVWNDVAQMKKRQAREVADASESEHWLEPDPALDEPLLLPSMLAPAQSQLADDASPWHKRSPEHLNSGVAIKLPEQCTESTAHHAESDIENNAIETGGLFMEIDGRLTEEQTEYAPSPQLKNSA
jgi:hypothetical protein